MAITLITATVALSLAKPMPAPLAKYVEMMQGANGVSATYFAQEIGGGKSQYTVTLSKPNLVRIDTPEKRIHSDGTNITVFMKASKEYFTKPTNEVNLASIFSEDALRPWGAFFSKDAFNNLTIESKSSVNRKGMTLDAVQAVLDASKGKTFTFLFDRTKGEMKQGLLEVKSGSETKTTVIEVETFAVTDKRDAEAFAFKAPEGSKQIQESDLYAAKWLYDLDEAMAVASKSNRMLLIDFFATWCGPCKLLEKNVFPTAEFKALSSKFVFVQIDVDKQQSVAQSYKIEAMPTTILANADGSEIGRFVGYMPAPEYIATVKQTAGL